MPLHRSQSSVLFKCHYFYRKSFKTPPKTLISIIRKILYIKSNEIIKELTLLILNVSAVSTKTVDADETRPMYLVRSSADVLSIWPLIKSSALMQKQEQFGINIFFYLTISESNQEHLLKFNYLYSRQFPMSATLHFHCATFWRQTLCSNVFIFYL